MSTVAGETWTMILAPAWQAAEEDSVITITHPNGVGALQVSAFQKRDGKSISLDDLQWQVIEQSPVPQSHLSKLQEQHWGEFSGLQVVYAAKGTFWRKWWLRCSSTLLFVTYNCSHGEESVEATEVNNMVSSLRYANALQPGIQPDGPASGGPAG